MWIHNIDPKSHIFTYIVLLLEYSVILVIKMVQNGQEFIKIIQNNEISIKIDNIDTVSNIISINAILKQEIKN